MGYGTLGRALDAVRASVPVVSTAGTGLRAVPSVRNDSPVPLTSRYGSVAPGGVLGGGLSNDRGAALDSMGASGTLFAIVDALSEGISQVRWKLWRPAKSGLPEDRAEVTSHAFLDLMANPNPFMTGQELIEGGQQHYELVGESWMTLTLASTIPLQIWPVRPDRMHPVSHPTKYMTGYVYCGPDGERVPLEIDEVEFIRRPHPDDPYRGIGAVQSILIDVGSAHYSAVWNRNFFLNSAEPGGIIEIPPEIGKLSDDDFNELRARWNDQHRGVNKAHRVAILEQGKWVDRKFTMKEMQFAELRGVSREIIREAFRFPKSLLGTTDDVNRAVAEAMDASYGRRLLVPRLERWKGALNNILRRFPTGRGLEYDYVSPVEEDREADRNDLTARAQAAEALTRAGWDHADVAEACGLPAMSVRELAPAAIGPAGQDDLDLAALVSRTVRAEIEPVRAAVAIASAAAQHAGAGRREVILVPNRAPWHGEHGPEPVSPPRAGGIVPPYVQPPPVRTAATSELVRVQQQWQAELDRTLAQWESEILPAQYDEAVMRVRDAVDAGDLAALSALAISSSTAAAVLTAAMSSLAGQAAMGMADEAVAQGAVGAGDEPEVPADVDALEAYAAVAAGALAAGVALSAVGAALRLTSPGATGEAVADGVREHLESLTDAQPRLWLGGALTMAQNNGRVAAARVLPETTYYASEENDINTCGPCGKIHGKSLGTLADVIEEYPSGGYRKCEGGMRCRGTFVAKWVVE